MESTCALVAEHTRPSHHISIAFNSIFTQTYLFLLILWFYHIFVFVLQHRWLRRAHAIWRNRKNALPRKWKNYETRWSLVIWAMALKRCHWSPCTWIKSISDKDQNSPQLSPICGWMDRVNSLCENWSKWWWRAGIVACGRLVMQTFYFRDFRFQSRHTKYELQLHIDIAEVEFYR